MIRPDLAPAPAGAAYPARRPPMLSDLADLFAATVQHAPATGFDRFGQASYGASTPYRARVLHRARLVRDAKGQQTVARGEVWIAGTPFVGLSDRITLPDGTSPPLITVESLSDEAGPSHIHVFFG